MEKRKGKPFEPVTVVSMISPIFRPFARHLIGHNVEEQPYLIIKAVCISAERYFFSSQGQKHTSLLVYQLLSFWSDQVQLIGWDTCDMRRQSAFDASLVFQGLYTGEKIVIFMANISYITPKTTKKGERNICVCVFVAPLNTQHPSHIVQHAVLWTIISVYKATLQKKMSGPTQQNKCRLNIKNLESVRLCVSVSSHLWLSIRWITIHSGLMP